MGKCEYVDDSASFADGWHCKLLRGHVDDRSLVNNYCRDSVYCEYCPVRGGDDRRRRRDPEPEEKIPEIREVHRDNTGETIRSGGGSSGGGGGIGLLFGEVGTFLKIFTVALAVVLVGMLVGHLFGMNDTWVNMQLPDGAVTKNAGLYAVNRDTAWGDPLFDVSSEEFDDEGHVRLRSYKNYSDAYFYQDTGAVWLGTNDLYPANETTVYDITYEEICQQLYRVVLVELRDTEGASIASGLTVTDGNGQSQRCVDMGNGSYAVLLPNDTETVALTFNSAGYESYTATMELSQRLTSVVVTLVQEGGNEA